MHFVSLSDADCMYVCGCMYIVDITLLLFPLSLWKAAAAGICGEGLGFVRRFQQYLCLRDTSSELFLLRHYECHFLNATVSLQEAKLFCGYASVAMRRS